MYLAEEVLAVADRAPLLRALPFPDLIYARSSAADAGAVAR